jgi:hypothetical protein
LLLNLKGLALPDRKDRPFPDWPDTKTDGYPGKRTPLFVRWRIGAARRDMALTGRYIWNLSWRVECGDPVSSDAKLETELIVFVAGLSGSHWASQVY